MAEITALERHSCAACGARAEWSARRQALVCAYCGTVSPYEIDTDTGKVREIGLVKTLRELPDELRGWKAPKRSVRCQSCRAISVFDPERVGQNCQFCGSPELVDYDELKAPIRPQSVLPFRVDATRARDAVRRWLGGKWLAPRAFATRALVDTIQGVYLPYWTFDARVDCRWTAESGTYYYTNEMTRRARGRRATRRVRHVRWRPASGRLTHVFDDQPVPGSKGTDTRLLREIEPFPTAEAMPYDTALLAGFVVEHYQVVLVEAAERARRSMLGHLTSLCAQQVPGDTQRNLRIEPSFSGQTFKHMLVPVWLLTYAHRENTYQVLVNGITGEIAGRYPKSAFKLLALALVAAATLALVALLLRGL
ncbi:MAG: zinc ribbon domain-containing protein [Acidobacteriota bacterium]|nr:zinc ribbon domain-containing protein [Acidobacteriota bacterium]